MQMLLMQREISIGKNVRFLVPVRCDGTGQVVIGNDTNIGCPQAPSFGNGSVLLQARLKTAQIRIGKRVNLSNNVTIIACENISIGNECLIGDSVSIIDTDGHDIDPEKRRTGHGKSKPISIGDNVWIGSRVIVQKGVSIGSNSVIAPMSVVTRDIPHNCIAGGIPAKTIRYIPESKI